jgi:hypothetical protein
MVAQFCEADQRKWDTRLPELMFALNTSRHESTRYTPALLNFGHELVVPNAVHRPAPGNAAADPPTDTAADEVKATDDAVHHSERLRLLKDTYELVRVNLARAFAKQSKYYNLRHREWRCHPGDRVLKRDHPLSSGAKGFAAILAPKYSGPYTVTKVLSLVVYNLQSPSGQKILRAHIKDLKPYEMPEPPADLANICTTAAPKTGRPGRPHAGSPTGRPQDPGAVPTGTAQSPGREDGDPDLQGRPQHVCSPTAEPDASGPNCQRGNLFAPANPTSRSNLLDR